MSPDQRADAARPTAHDLVRAVAAYDRVGVARALRYADLTAVCVVLADMVANPSDALWLGSLLRDLRDPWLTPRQVATRYGIEEGVLHRFCTDNGIDERTDDELTGGCWVNHRGVMRWVPGEVA